MKFAYEAPIQFILTNRLWPSFRTEAAPITFECLWEMGWSLTDRKQPIIKLLAVMAPRPGVNVCLGACDCPKFGITASTCWNCCKELRVAPCMSNAVALNHITRVTESNVLIKEHFYNVTSSSWLSSHRVGEKIHNSGNISNHGNIIYNSEIHMPPLNQVTTRFHIWQNYNYYYYYIVITLPNKVKHYTPNI